MFKTSNENLVAQPLPHDGDALVEDLEGERDVVLVGVAVLHEALGDALAEGPQLVDLDADSADVLAEC